MKIKAAALILLLVGLSAPVSAENGSSVIKRLEKYKIGIRKSFAQSSKDEQKPAVFFWGRDFKNNFNYTLIDLGLKISELELLRNARSSLLIYPQFEWHKDGSNKEKEKNTLSAGLNAQFYPFGLGAGSQLVAPWFQASASYQDDRVSGLQTLKLNGCVSVFGTKPYWPGSDIRHKDASGNPDGLALRYYPYTGIEYYSSVGSAKGHASFWMGRLFVDWYPFPSMKGEFFQINLDAGYRLKLSDSLYLNKNLYFVSLAANIYPDGSGKFGFGVEYSKGYDPNNSFVECQRINIGFKIKL